MAIFHQTDATGGKKKLSSAVIVVIILVVLLCCCCAAVVIGLVATGTITVTKIKDLTYQDSYLPIFLTVRTWL